MLCLSKLAKASVTLYSLCCSTELVGSASTESRFVTVSIWYSLDSFNSSLKAFGVMNRKPALKKERHNKAWLREPTVTKVTGPMRPVTGNRKVARFPGNDLPFVCKVGLLITN